MKHKLIFLLPLSFSLMGIKEKPDIFGPIIPLRIINMTFEPIGPCDEYGTDINLTGTITSTDELVDVKERLSVGISGSSYVHFSTSVKHTISANVPYNFSFTLPIHSMLSKTGIDCKVALLDSTSSELKSYTFTLKPSSHERINVSDYINNHRFVYDVIVDPDDYQNKRMEQYQFVNFLDYFNEDNYYRLNLKRLRIHYYCFNGFPGCNAKLKFIDYNRVFPLLDNNEPIPSFEIPLRYSTSGSYLWFDFPEQMYVNPDNMEMSLNAKPGYRLTKYFYLPINKKESLLDQVFTLNVSDFGYDKVSFSWNITYLNNRNLLGDCNNSDYCVVGEIE